MTILKSIELTPVETGAISKAEVYSYLCDHCDQVHVGVAIDVGPMRTELRMMDVEARLLACSLSDVLDVEPAREGR